MVRDAEEEGSSSLKCIMRFKTIDRFIERLET